MLRVVGSFGRRSLLVVVDREEAAPVVSQSYVLSNTHTMSVFAKALSPALREVRILCSQTGPASAGIRAFIVSKYPIIKKHNPDLPVMIREATGTPARVFARFERGVERHVELDGLSSAEVEKQVGQLLES